MFSLISGIYEEYFSPPQINLLIVGAQGAGKTALMERLKVIDFSSNSSTASSKGPSLDHKVSKGTLQSQNYTRQQQTKSSSTRREQSSSLAIRKVPKTSYIFFPETPKKIKSTDSTDGGIDSDSNNKVTKSNNRNEVSSTDDDNVIDEDDNDSFTNQSIGMSTNDESDDENTLGNYSTASGGTLNSKKKVKSWRNAKLALLTQNDHDPVNNYDDTHDEDGDTFNGDDENSLKKSSKANAVQNHHEIELNQNIHDEIRANRRQRGRILHRRGSGINESVHQSKSKVKSLAGTSGGSTTSTTLTTTTVGTASSTGGTGLIVGTGVNNVDTVLNPSATSIATTTANMTSATVSSTVVAITPRPWYAKFCPAPQRYKKYDDDQDEEQVQLFDDGDDDDENDIDDDDDDQQRTSLHNKVNKTHRSDYNESFGDGSMESVEFDETNDNGSIRRSSLSCVQEGKEIDDSCEQELTFPDGSSDLNEVPQYQHVEYDLKLNSKMLPLHKINRTIGMNLTKKLSINSANVSVWDLGGRLSDLWERYYADADAVLFVWKINISQARIVDDDDDDRSKMIVSSEYQLKLLEQVRDSVPDDVPFVIFCHIFDPTTIKDNVTNESQKSRHQQRQRRRYDKIQQFCKTDQLYSITTLLPNHPVVNNCQGIFFGNASTGQGVKTAIEWTIRSAKIQQKIRELQ